MSGQIEYADPENTLVADDFFYVLTDVTETVVRVMTDEGRAVMADDDRAFISRRVHALVHPGPGASEAMTVTHEYSHLQRGGSEGAEQMRVQRLDHVVCRLAGSLALEGRWASGVVHVAGPAGPPIVGDEDARREPGRAGGATRAYVHVRMDGPNGRLVAVPEHACHLQRAAACNDAPVDAPGCHDPTACLKGANHAGGRLSRRAPPYSGPGLCDAPWT